MILPIDDLGCHVSRCAGSVLVVFRSVDSCDSKIGEAEVAFAVENEILGFEVAVNDVVVVHILEAENDAADKELDDVLGKAFVLADLVPQVAPRHVVHDQVEVESVLEGKDHVDEERVPQL